MDEYKKVDLKTGRVSPVFVNFPLNMKSHYVTKLVSLVIVVAVVGTT